MIQDAHEIMKQFEPVDLDSSEIVAYVELVSWRHGERYLMSISQTKAQLFESQKLLLGQTVRWQGEYWFFYGIRNLIP